MSAIALNMEIKYGERVAWNGYTYLFNQLLYPRSHCIYNSTTILFTGVLIFEQNTAKMSSYYKKIELQLKRLQKTALPFIDVVPVDQDKSRWEGTMKGPENTPYQGRSFKIAIYFPPEYDKMPPKIKFKTLLYHPNVTENGGILLEQLTPRKWSPSYRMTDVFEMIHQMLAQPIFDEPEYVVTDIADCYKNDREVFNWLATRPVDEE